MSWTSMTFLREIKRASKSRSGTMTIRILGRWGISSIRWPKVLITPANSDASGSKQRITGIETTRNSPSIPIIRFWTRPTKVKLQSLWCSWDHNSLSHPRNGFIQSSNNSERATSNFNHDLFSMIRTNTRQSTAEKLDQEESLARAKHWQLATETKSSWANPIQTTQDRCSPKAKMTQPRKEWKNRHKQGTKLCTHKLQNSPSPSHLVPCLTEECDTLWLMVPPITPADFPAWRQERSKMKCLNLKMAQGDILPDSGKSRSRMLHLQSLRGYRVFDIWFWY